MGPNVDANGYVLIHLGRRSAGPRILAEVAKSLSKEGKLRGIVFSKYADNAEELYKLQTQRIPIRTYTSKFTFVLSVLMLPFQIWKIDQMLNEFNDADVMFVMHHIWDPILLSSINKRKRNRVIYWVHDAQNHVGESRQLNRTLVTSALRYADVIVTLSEHVSKELNERMNGLNIVRISHPVIIHEELKTIEEKSNLQVLFLGRISKYKGLDRLAAAWPTVLQSLPDAKLVIAGDGEHELVQKLFKSLTNYSIIPKYLSDTQMADLLNSSALVVLPYDEASQSGILVKAVEYAIPYVATPVGGLIEQNIELGGGVIVNDLAPRTLAFGIIKLLSGTSNYRTPVLRQNLSFDSQIKSLESKIRELNGS
jgi:glycosyltransferase involved in cell wall biosynthesis